jgi:hypothetical protein
MRRPYPLAKNNGMKTDQTIRRLALDAEAVEEVRWSAGLRPTVAWKGATDGRTWQAKRISSCMPPGYEVETIDGHIAESVVRCNNEVGARDAIVLRLAV